MSRLCRSLCRLVLKIAVFPQDFWGGAVPVGNNFARVQLNSGWACDAAGRICPVELFLLERDIKHGGSRPKHRIGYYSSIPAQDNDVDICGVAKAAGVGGCSRYHWDPQFGSRARLGPRS